MAIWGSGVRTYLPRADRVLLSEMTEGDPPVVKRRAEVPFSAIEPFLTRVPGLHSERWETGAFPLQLLEAHDQG